MIFDIIVFVGIGTVLGIVGHIFWLELKSTGKIKPAVSATVADLEGFGQILTHGEQAVLARLESIGASLQPDYERFKAMIADALNELKAAADAKEAAAVAAATAPAVAEAQAADEQAVRDFTAANFPAGQ